MMKHKPPLKRWWIRVDCAVAGFGTFSFGIFSWWACTAGLHDEQLAAKYAATVDPNITYLIPASCFFTAFVLNCLTMLFERDSQRLKLAYFGTYIQLLAAWNDYLSFMGIAPIVPGYSENGVHVLRYVMWAHTTPAMVYLLSLLSDFSRQQVIVAMVADVLMIVCGLLGSVLSSPPLSAFCMMVSFALFPWVMSLLWSMFQAAIASTINRNNEASLRVLRQLTLGFWFSFPVIWLASAAGVLSLPVEEALWTTCDFCDISCDLELKIGTGKVMFSSSLLYGNFLTLEQRKLVAMRVIEESNRLQVIKELQELIEQKETFMSSMTHELRTPLNGIIGLSESVLIGGCGAVSSAVVKVVTTIKNSGGRLLSLINDILDAASMRKGSLVIKRERVNLSDITNDVLEICSPLPRREVVLVSNVPPSCPLVQGDADRIIQIMHNLVGNACKFTHRGSITVDAVASGNQVEVSVSDTGIGIPQDKLGDIFRAYKQVDTRTTQKYGGTGLGLSLVKQLVEAHGSSIIATSTVGAGSSFSFTLQAWDPAKGDVTVPTPRNVVAPPPPVPADVAPPSIVQSQVEALEKEVALLKKDKAVLEEQLDEVSNECERLQDLNDDLEGKVGK